MNCEGEVLRLNHQLPGICNFDGRCDYTEQTSATTNSATNTATAALFDGKVDKLLTDRMIGDTCV